MNKDSVRSLACSASLASREADTGSATPSPRSYSRAQLAWLSFHAVEPAPHQWAWLDADGRHVTGHPDTWVRLRARKRVGFFIQSCSIRASDTRALDPFFDGFPKVNAAGLALLKASQPPPTSDGEGISEGDMPTELNPPPPGGVSR